MLVPAWYGKEIKDAVSYLDKNIDSMTTKELCEKISPFKGNQAFAQILLSYKEIPFSVIKQNVLPTIFEKPDFSCEVARRDDVDEETIKEYIMPIVCRNRTFKNYLKDGQISKRVLTYIWKNGNENQKATVIGYIKPPFAITSLDNLPENILTQIANSPDFLSSDRNHAFDLGVNYKELKNFTEYMCGEVYKAVADAIFEFHMESNTDFAAFESENNCMSIFRKLIDSGKMPESMQVDLANRCLNRESKATTSIQGTYCSHLFQYLVMNTKYPNVLRTAVKSQDMGVITAIYENENIPLDMINEKIKQLVQKQKDVPNLYDLLHWHEEEVDILISLLKKSPFLDIETYYRFINAYQKQKIMYYPIMKQIAKSPYTPIDVLDKLKDEDAISVSLIARINKTLGDIIPYKDIEPLLNQLDYLQYDNSENNLINVFYIENEKLHEKIIDILSNYKGHKVDNATLDIEKFIKNMDKKHKVINSLKEKGIPVIPFEDERYKNFIKVFIIDLKEDINIKKEDMELIFRDVPKDYKDFFIWCVESQMFQMSHLDYIRNTEKIKLYNDVLSEVELQKENEINI